MKRGEKSEQALSTGGGGARRGLETGGERPQLDGLARVPNTHSAESRQAGLRRNRVPFGKCHFRHFRLLTPQTAPPITRLTAEDCGAARRQRLKQASEITKKLAI